MDAETALLTPAGLAQLFRSVTFAFINEAEVQHALFQLMLDKQIPGAEEVRLTAADRIDLVADLPGCRLGIEVKVQGEAAAVRRQLTRYSCSPDINELMIVTTQRRHLINLPEHLSGMLLHKVLLRGRG